MGSQVSAVWMAEEGTTGMLLRLPYSTRANSLLCAVIPPQHRQKKYGWGYDYEKAAWKYPIEYWDLVEDIIGQVYTKVPLYIVDELPELPPLNVEDVT